MIAGTNFNTLDLARLIKSQTHPLYVRAFIESACPFGDDDADASMAELDEDAVWLEPKEVMETRILRAVLMDLVGHNGV